MDSLESKVAQHEVRIQEQERRILSIETDNKALSKIANTLEEQMIDRKENDEKHNQVLEKINKNLTSLNSRFDYVEQRVDSLERNREDGQIDINKLWKTTIFRVIPAVLGGFILAYLTFKFGLK